ncbi:hypothetical protein TrST_g5738 [Triparma strigata]|uniref:Tyrosine-protein kinase ephrin type A/B receptor-like domain-containing protein n=1 Tax=Triparma strigata TaxID=1606541 RepID=A0A9W6ZQA8_9STRA|nr:hypothetical protein TrST_g5738 [Triparma strigata]
MSFDIGTCSLTSCPAGEYGVGSGCFDCDAGKFSGEGSNSCSSCPAGKHINSGVTGDESSVCSNCSIGKYVELDAADSCLFCPAGKINPDITGASSVSACSVECAIGEGPSSDSTRCESCPRGTYSPLAGSGCLECGRGKYLNVTGASVILLAFSAHWGSLPLRKEHRHTARIVLMGATLLERVTHCV